MWQHAFAKMQNPRNARTNIGWSPVAFTLDNIVPRNPVARRPLGVRRAGGTISVLIVLASKIVLNIWSHRAHFWQRGKCTTRRKAFRVHIVVTPRLRVDNLMSVGSTAPGHDGHRASLFNFVFFCDSIFFAIFLAEKPHHVPHFTFVLSIKLLVSSKIFHQFAILFQSGMQQPHLFQILDPLIEVPGPWSRHRLALHVSHELWLMSEREVSR
mmetsp:Transcript_22719/g.38055  ORF Transcript_22719/g.38055 Transcript_22719/m.38055 type:complete len:212 (-) Transcript_22719:610-1245(-)